MASVKKAPGDVSGELDDDTDYNFKMKSPYKMGRFLFSVLYSYTAKGSVIKTIPADKLGEVTQVVLPSPE